jgi:hypothetical protein
MGDFQNPRSLPPEQNDNTTSSQRTDEEQSREQQATTAFVSDASVVKAEDSMISKVSSLFYKSSTDQYEQSIKTFFEKPVNIMSGNFSNGDSVSTFYTTPYSLKYSPHDFIKPFTVRSTKLSGFLGFRATCVVRLVINATRFQQGRYMLAYIPSGGSSPASSKGQAWNIAHWNQKHQRTQLPRVEFDLNCDTEVELRIPYVSSANYVPTAAIITDTNYLYATGTFVIFPYKDLIVGSGSATAGFTMWQHFEDVELIGPATPQSGQMFTTKKRSKKSVSSQEQESNGLGPISSPLTAISKGFSSFAQVPGLSTYAGPASWVTERLAGCAKIFGFSRPHDISPAHRMVRSIVPYVGTVDNSDTSLPLSLSASNAVTQAEGFSGSNMDELDFKNIVSIYSYFKEIPMASASGQSGDLLGSWNLNPDHFWYQTTGVGGKLFNHYQPLAFVAQYFSLWRGSLRFRIKIVKTEFHSGRIAICFNPIEPGVTTTALSYANSDYLHREIVDLRYSSEIEFAVPFISSSPWKSVRGTDNNLGTIGIYTVDPLQAPSSVPGSIYFLCEVSGGPDFEFAVPRNNTSLVPCFGVTPQSGKMFSSKNDSCSIERVSIGASSEAVNINNSAFCIGESVTSFRSLLKTFSLMLNQGSYDTTKNIVSFLPFAWDYYYNNASPVIPNWNPDIYGTLCSIFAMSRGGVRWKFIEPLGPANSATNTLCGFTTVSLDQTTGPINQMIYEGTGNYISPTEIFIGSSTGTRAFFQSGVGVHPEVNVPQYHRYHSRSNLDHMCNTTYNYSTGIGNLSTRNFVEYYSTNNNPLSIPMRAGSDDVNFGCFISIPPMTLVANGVART